MHRLVFRQHSTIALALAILAESLRQNIALLLGEGKSWSKIQSLLGCSRSTIAKVKNLTN
ncbi:helix-turn-helix domain-containing protein [Vibrio aestuarianus]|nr:helix-turn-helix domain-containing protein [Vibrio aestuarianus]MDE1247518.1 helix-turn-helix domain-containing protein [Vibrio aestuarianus]